MTKKTSGYFPICHIFALELNYSPVLLSVRAFSLYKVTEAQQTYLKLPRTVLYL